MPKSAEFADNDTEGAVIHHAANGISEDALRDYATTFEELQDKIDEVMRMAREACVPFREQMKDILKDAAENDVEKKPFMAKLRERRLRRKAEQVADALSEDQKEIFAEISSKLGDLPLFSSAELGGFR